MSLLRVNPEHRPRSAFEVMQRLAAIGGIANPEAGDFSQAYLHAPTLVGRETELQRFRASTRRASARRGSTQLAALAPSPVPMGTVTAAELRVYARAQ